MHDPIRLRNDPAQSAAMRSALQAEIAAPMGSDLAALKANLGQQIATGASASALGLGPKLLMLLGLGALGAWWLQPAPTTQRAPIAIVAEAQPEPLAQAPVPIQTRPAPAPMPLALPPPEVEVPAAKAVLPPRAPEPRRARRARPPAPAPEAPKPSGLAAEMASYKSAQSALSARRYLPAAAHFADYLKAYPEGSFRDEATLGQLEALHHAKQPAKVVALAWSILNTQRIPERQAEVLRVLAEAEVMRGRCQSAQEAFAQANDNGADIDDSTRQSALQACESRAMQ